MDNAKVGLLAQVRMIFDQFYPFRAPKIQLINKKGLDQDQFEELLQKICDE